MQDIVAELKATAGPHSGNRHTATTADGQATLPHTNQQNRPPNRPPRPTQTAYQTAYQAALPHTNQPPRL